MVEKSETYVKYVVSHRPYPTVIHNNMVFNTPDEAKTVRDKLNEVAAGLKIYKVYPIELSIVKEEVK